MQINHLNTANIEQTNSTSNASQVNGNNAAHIETDKSIDSLVGNRVDTDSVGVTLSDKECKLESLNEKITYYVEMLKDCINNAFDKITGKAEYDNAPQALLDQSVAFAEKLEQINNKAEEIQNCIQTTTRIDKNEAESGMRATTNDFLKLMATGSTKPEHNLKAALGMAKMLAQTHGQSLSHDIGNANDTLKSAFESQLKKMSFDEQFQLKIAASSSNIEITKGAIEGFRNELINSGADSWMINRAENMLFVIQNFETSVLGNSELITGNATSFSDSFLGASERAAMENIRNR